MSITTDLLGVFTNITPSIVDIYIGLFGIPSDIYYPLDVQQHLYDDHSKITYNSTPDIVGQQLLIVNFMNSKALRGNLTQFEDFFGEGEERPFIITHESLRLKPRTRIDAWFGSAKMSFQTELDEVITGVTSADGTYSTILVKQLLRPLT